MAVGGQRHSRTWYDTGSGGLSLGRRRTTTFMGTQHAHDGWSRRVGLDDGGTVRRKERELHFRFWHSVFSGAGAHRERKEKDGLMSSAVDLVALSRRG